MELGILTSVNAKTTIYGSKLREILTSYQTYIQANHVAMNAANLIDMEFDIRLPSLKIINKIHTQV